MHAAAGDCAAEPSPRPAGHPFNVKDDDFILASFMAARQAGAVSATSRYEAGQVSVKVWFIPPDDTLLEETRKLQLASVGVRQADVERRLAASAAKAGKERERKKAQKARRAAAKAALQLALLSKPSRRSSSSEAHQ